MVSATETRGEGQLHRLGGMMLFETTKGDSRNFSKGIQNAQSSKRGQAVHLALYTLACHRGRLCTTMYSYRSHPFYTREYIPWSRPCFDHSRSFPVFYWTLIIDCPCEETAWDELGPHPADALTLDEVSVQSKISIGITQPTVRQRQGKRPPFSFHSGCAWVSLESLCTCLLFT